ncbi:hypothetical protein KVT40_009091 [Elsinoe batatas]|uniref:Large ribosomal subunit protein bL34m n=1 Tax=Elsinoe batatas TaxID=2601811 RepID=A0A8K0KYA3_9PEZI|nr:hypothetical protein KVT40_009091 [Elsinoe batatas]
MLCLRCSRLAPPSPLTTLSSLRSALPSTALRISSPPARRNITISTLPRPTLSSPRLESSTSPILSTLQSTSTTSTTSPPSSGLGSLLLTRGAKRDTYDPSHLVRKRRHGFLARLRTRKGRNTINRRRTKGRRDLSH